jgi:hypothetical protein
MPLLERWTPWREFDLMDRRMRRFEDLGLRKVRSGLGVATDWLSAPLGENADVRVRT